MNKWEIIESKIKEDKHGWQALAKAWLKKKEQKR